jgi:CheY-like chemotaxis protein
MTAHDDLYHPEPFARPVKRSATILVLDDDPALGALLARALWESGFTPVVSGSLRELVVLCEQQPIDAFVLDVMLGGRDSGIDALAWIRAQSHFGVTPVVMLTGVTALPEDAEAIIRRDRAYVFYKPEGLDTVVQHLSRLMLGAVSN